MILRRLPLWKEFSFREAFARFSGFQLFGFFTPPHNPPMLDFLFSLFGVLSFPLGLLPSTAQSPFWVGFTMIALSLLNSGIWGFSLGSLFYAAKRLFQKHTAASYEGSSGKS